MTARGLETFDLVIFDWAGTVVDFGCQAPVAALIAAFARRDLALDKATARADMGRAKSDHVRAILARAEIAAAWEQAHGATPNEADAEAVMADLAPMMREEAARAAELIPGAAKAAADLRVAGLKVGSSTGYTREMMADVLPRAAAQGFAPDHLVCAGETPMGRPTPLMIYKACAELGVWPLSRVVKVDDSEAGVAEGRAAGCFTIGIAASGNGMGLSRQAFESLNAVERQTRLATVRRRLRDAGADIVIDTVADLVESLKSATP